MSHWKEWHGELDENGHLAYGKFQVCTTCGKGLPSLPNDQRFDEEELIYHGYCSRKCASEDSYGNYVW